jgi:hypothetical protein
MPEKRIVVNLDGIDAHSVELFVDMGMYKLKIIHTTATISSCLNAIAILTAYDLHCRCIN